MAKREFQGYHFWTIDIMQDGMSIKAACIKHNIHSATAYKWLEQHPKIRETYMQSRQGRRMRWRDEKKCKKKKNPSSSGVGRKSSGLSSAWKKNEKRKANLAWAARIKRDALQERREWLWMLLTGYKMSSKYRKLLEAELAQIEKDLRA